MSLWFHSLDGAIRLRTSGRIPELEEGCIFGGKQCMTDEISMVPDEGCFLGGPTGSIEGGLQRTRTGGSLPKCEFLLSSVCAVR